jgi:hypothetical protein
MQAGAADLVALDHDHGHPELGGAQGCGIAPASGAQDGEIDGLAGRAHAALLCVLAGGLSLRLPVCHRRQTASM